MNDIVRDRFHQISRKIQSAKKGGDLSFGGPTLVAVSKTVPIEKIKLLLDAGHRVFGENRVQEAARKWPQLRENFSGINLHLIGPLQSNKTAIAVSLFDCIETLDRPKLAKTLAVEFQKQRKPVELFVQVNTGAEPQKSGVLEDDLSGFLELCRNELALQIGGLMCIPPVGDNPQDHFLKLADLAKSYHLEKLSMGMSADFDEAIRCGATHIRVGSAIFGSR